MKLLHSCRMMRAKKTQGLGFNGIFFEKEGLLFPCPLQMLFILVLYSSTYPKIILKAVLCICDSDELCLFNIIFCFIFIMAINCCGCNKKLTRLNKNNLEFVTKLYCSLECLNSFCFEHLQRCCHCNVLVEDKARIKYCTRFGTKVEQFCSHACLENYKKLNTFCTLCKQKLGVMVISKEKGCLKAYNWLCPDESDAVKTSCSLCGCKLVKCKVNFFLGGWIIGFCSEQCSSIYLTINSEILTCGVCNIKKLNFDLIRRSGKKSEYFCSVPCLTERLNEEEKQDHFDGAHRELLGSRFRNNHLRSSTESCIERYKREQVKKFLEKWAGKTEEKSIQTNKWEGYFYQKINSATQCFNSVQTSSSQTDDTLGSKGVNISNLIFTPFPVHVPTPVGMDAQFQIIPIFSPVPVPIPIPLLKKREKILRLIWVQMKRKGTPPP
ncbi:hypothetical protein Anas_08493 [Armadillidium nasatum]|uniref:TRASH domain-containing protein n=1 Tax=Armadillidium nasatum TaxID=96803 RepID=A0A5N5T715_9CRUS|nr:hypothetical protein Anas_08493 [Armadillidium nasatum]